MCTNKDFVHLHCHTHFSIQDALPTPAKLAYKARKEGFRAVAITDHGKMAGTVEFVENCRKNDEGLSGIKPIIGLEYYTCPNRFDKSKTPEGKRQKLNHLTVLAQNNQGYKNMLEMTYLASQPDVFHYSPRIDWDALSSRSEGLIVLSGCLASEINQTLLVGNYSKAKSIAGKFKEVFQDRYFIELQYHGIEDQKRVLPDLIKIAHELDIPTVVSNDVHYLEANDWKIHDVLIQMRDMREDKDKKNGKKEAYSSHQFHLKSAEDMKRIFGEKTPSALSNSVLISEMVEDYFKLDAPHLLPEASIDLQDESFIRFWKQNLPYHKSNEAYLAFLSYSGLKSLGLDSNSSYVKRLKYELETVWNMGVTDYFLIQKEMVNFLKDSEIFFGVRGSGGGSLINYCLSVSSADPIRWNLMFERFLNPGRGTQYKVDLECYPAKEWFEHHEKEVQTPYVKELKRAAQEYIDSSKEESLMPRLQREIWVLENQGLASYLCGVAESGRTQTHNDCHLWMAYILGITKQKPEGDLLVSKIATLPDIDTDLDDHERERVINWTKERFGEANVMPVGTWGTYGAKAAVVGVLKTSEKFIKRNTNTHAEALKVSACIPSKPGMTIELALTQSPELQHWASVYPEEIANAKKLIGTNSNLGVHASAVVVSKNPIYEDSPIELSKSKASNKATLVTAFDMKNVERVGLVKYDYLGLATHHQIKLCLQLIKTRRGIDLDINTIPLDDPKVFNKVYKKGNANSIFQCGSKGMQKALKEIEASNIEDLIAVLSLYRPGPLDYIPDYANGKRRPQSIKYSHPLIEKHLSKTYGIMIYQEQAMFLARDMAKLSWQEVDKLRKAISKKSGKDFDEACQLLHKRSLENGIPEAAIQEVLHLMQKFGGYAFNRTHACLYALLSYTTAYLRTYYAPEWFAACIESDHDDIDKVAIYLNECRNEKPKPILVKEPNVNESNMFVTVNTSGEILMPLTTLKGVGALAQVVVANQPYTSLEDLAYRARPNKGIVAALANSGGLQCLPDCNDVDADVIMEKWAEIITQRNKSEKKSKTQAPSYSTPITKSLLDIKKSSDNISQRNKQSITSDDLFEGF